MINCNSCGQLIRKELTVCPFCGAIQEEKTVFVNTSNQMGYVPPQPAMNQPQQPGGFGQSGMQPQQPGGFGQSGMQPQQPGSYGQSGMQPQQMGYGQSGMQPYQMGYGQQMGGYGQPRPVKANKQGGGKGKLIALISVIAVLAIAAVFAIILFVGPGALSQKGAVEAYLEAMADKDAKAYIKACYPTKLYKAILKEYGMTKDEAIADVEDTLKYYTDFLAVKNIKITDSEEYDKDEVKAYKEYVKEEIGVNVNISKVIELRVEYKYKDSDGEWEDDYMYIDVYKVGFKWYVME